MGDLNRAAFLAGAAMLSVLPRPARAEEAAAAKRYRVKARFDRLFDKRTMRQLEMTVADGKTVQALDGEWSYDQMPRTPRGLLVTVTVKGGEKIDVRYFAEFGYAESKTVAGRNVQTTIAKLDGEDDFAPGQERSYPWNIAGEDYALVMSVTLIP